MNKRNAARPIELTQDALAQLLEYEPSTGLLRWKSRPARMFISERSARAWNKRHAGNIAGTIKRPNPDKEYVQVNIGGRLYLAHRLIWFLVSGALDDDLVIDHMNGNGLDNRLANLRHVAREDNQRNQALRKSSKSGTSGVYWSARESRWHAQIMVGGVRKSLGYHSSLELAVAARKEQEAKNGYHRLHGLPADVRASAI